MKTADEIIQKLQLQPHPEGGYFKETYRSEGLITEENLESNYIGNRNFSSCIYFLLTSDRFSAFHKIHQDEIWHFYQGSPIRIHMISMNGDYSNVVVGLDFDQGQAPQFVVLGNTYFASEVLEKDSYGLVGCTVSPGFDFNDFELPSQQELLSKFPQHAQVIANFST